MDGEKIPFWKLEWDKDCKISCTHKALGDSNSGVLGSASKPSKLEVPPKKSGGIKESYMTLLECLAIFHF